MYDKIDKIVKDVKSNEVVEKINIANYELLETLAKNNNCIIKLTKQNIPENYLVNLIYTF